MKPQSSAKTICAVTTARAPPQERLLFGSLQYGDMLFTTMLPSEKAYATHPGNQRPSRATNSRYGSAPPLDCRRLYGVETCCPQGSYNAQGSAVRSKVTSPIVVATALRSCGDRARDRDRDDALRLSPLWRSNPMSDGLMPLFGVLALPHSFDTPVRAFRVDRSRAA